MDGVSRMESDESEREREGMRGLGVKQRDVGRDGGVVEHVPVVRGSVHLRMQISQET